MHIKPIKTHKITPYTDTIYQILDQYLPEPLAEKSIILITSKIVAICQGRVVKTEEMDKDDLIKREAALYLPRHMSRYNFFLTIKDNIMVASSGIDESNAGDYYVLWPEKTQEIANQIRQYLCQKYDTKYLGVVIIDSRIYPLRRGSSGIALSHSGFVALKDYVGSSDIFGKELKYTKANIMDSLASVGVLVMGEGAEQTPIATIIGADFIEFQDRNPTPQELASMRIIMEDDLYAPMLTNVEWLKGGS